MAIWSTYRDNIHNIQPSTVSKFESFLVSNPEYYYNQVQGLINEGAKGRIYSGWKPISDADYKALDLPKTYVLDFGYSGDPNALIEVKSEGMHRYVKELIYEPGLDNLQLALKMRALGITSQDLVIADPGGGGDLRIAELRRSWPGYPDLRFNVRSAVKGQGSVNFGIGRVKSAIVHMTESSINGWKEYQEYKWRLDADKNPTDTPEGENNHIMDCIRYFELTQKRSQGIIAFSM